MNYSNILTSMISASDRPEELESIIIDFAKAFKPVIYSAGKEILNILKDFSNQTEYFDTIAKIKKKYFDAYIGAGFTEEQAFSLMINDTTRMKEELSKMKGSNQKQVR